MAEHEEARVTAVAHDYFTQHGGAERVAAALIAYLQPTRVLTTVYQRDTTFSIGLGMHLETTFLQRVRAFREDPRRALPLLPLAWALFKPVTAGVLLCSSSGWAHGARARRPAKKIVYCHNPARWLYQADEFFADHSRVLRMGMRVIEPLLRAWDRRAALTADLYIANSAVVADRVRSAYGFESIIIPPPLSLNAEGEQCAMEGLPTEYFLTVGRARGYKNTDRLIEAFERRPQLSLVCVGPKSPNRRLPSNVRFTGRVSDEQLRFLYCHARALLSVSSEDFGLTPIEANLFGTPALVLKAGGFLDSIDEGVSGLFLQSDDPQQVARALDNFPRQWNRAEILAHAKKFSMERFVERLGSAVANLDRENQAFGSSA